MGRYSYVKAYSDDHYDKRLADYDLAVGDLVLYSSGRDETGGIIFQIVEDTSPQRPHTTQKTIMRNRQYWDDRANKYVDRLTQVTDHGFWDANGKKLLHASVAGFVRIKPTFDFFATRGGKHPKGKGQTLIITYDDIKQLIKVDLVMLGAKYVELGNLLHSIAVKNGMNEKIPTE